MFGDLCIPRLDGCYRFVLGGGLVELCVPRASGLVVMSDLGG